MIRGREEKERGGCHCWKTGALGRGLNLSTGQGRSPVVEPGVVLAWLSGWSCAGRRAVVVLFVLRPVVSWAI